MGDTVTAHVLFDSARILLEPIVRQDPEDFRSHSALGIAYAGLGRVKEAIREADLVESLMPVSKDAITGAFMLVEQAYTYILAGEYDRAIDAFEHIVSLPQTAWMGRFRLDPRLDPLRDHPRFQALIEKYESEHGS